METIDVVDLTTGSIAGRRRDTPTLDIPHDLDRATGGVSVDAALLAHYFASGGERLICAATPVRLSQRIEGDECLVADDLLDGGGHSAFRRYRLSIVERPDEA